MIDLLLVSALAVTNHTIGDLQRAKPQPQVERCFLNKLGVMLGMEERKVNGHRVNVQRFDRNGDGEQDLLLVYEYVGTKGYLRPFPTFYRFDNDYDGKPDIEYVDQLNNGMCKDMVRVPIDTEFMGKRLRQ